VLGHVTGVQIENKKLMLQNHRRTRQGAWGDCLAPHFWKNMEIRVNVRKIKNIRADLSENRSNSGDFVTILHKMSGKLGKHQPRTHMFKTSAQYSKFTIHPQIQII
jgi:hypothetical protein